MKKILLSLFCLVLLFSCQQNSESPVQAVAQEDAEAVVNNLFTALATGDTTLMENTLTADFHMFEHELRWNKDSLLSLMPHTLGRIWEISEVKMEQDGDLIHLSYFNDSKKPLGRSWLESVLIEKQAGALRIKFMHSTKLYLQ